jgi:hypothetical protein
MAANTIPDNKDRDAVIQETSGKASPKRSDTLNGEPRTKSVDHGSPNFSAHKTSDLGGPPSPNNPYK